MNGKGEKRKREHRQNGLIVVVLPRFFSRFHTAPFPHPEQEAAKDLAVKDAVGTSFEVSLTGKRSVRARR